MKKIETLSTRIVLVWDLISVILYLITLFTNKTMSTIISWLSTHYALVMIVIGIIATIYVVLVDRIKHVVKQTIDSTMNNSLLTMNNSIKEVEDRYKSYTDSFSSWFIYTSAISKIVHERVISTMTEEELAKIFYKEGFLIQDLERFGFSKTISNQILKMYHQDELLNINNELNKPKDEPYRDIE